MKTNIEKNNKLIAEYMGYKQYVYKSPYSNNKEIYYYKGDYSNEELNLIAENYPWNKRLGLKKTLIKELNYHSDWNDLMKVIEKIENLGYTPRIEKSDNNIQFCWIWDNKKPDDNPVVVGYSDNKLEAVYEAVVEFIKYYNKK